VWDLGDGGWDLKASRMLCFVLVCRALELKLALLCVVLEIMHSEVRDVV